MAQRIGHSGAHDGAVRVAHGDGGAGVGAAGDDFAVAGVCRISGGSGCCCTGFVHALVGFVVASKSLY